MPKILHPEERTVPTWWFKRLYQDAVDNGKIPRLDQELSWREMALALHEEGVITLAKEE